MENRRNYYRILHVQRDAPVEIIRTSYRTMMQRLRMHPDLGGDHWTATVINEAYATLSDPVRREAYDRDLETSVDRENVHRTSAAHAEPSPPETAPRETAAGECPFCGTNHNQLQLQDDAMCGRCESPLAPATPDQHDDVTRRAMARMPKTFPLTYRSDWPARRLSHGCALDLSPAGMRLQTDDYLPAGKLVTIDSDVCSAIARVRSCRQSAAGADCQFEVGVQFVTLRFHRTQGRFVSVTA